MHPKLRLIPYSPAFGDLKSNTGLNSKWPWSKLQAILAPIGSSIPAVEALNMKVNWMNELVGLSSTILDFMFWLLSNYIIYYELLNLLYTVAFAPQLNSQPGFIKF